MNDIIVPINYLAVLGAAIISMVLGFLWYGLVFGKIWMALTGITKEQIDTQKSKGLAKSYVIMIVGSLLTSYVLAHALIFASTYTKTTGISAGLMTGFWNWLGFIAPVTIGIVLWENKPWKLWMLNAGYWLVSLLVMGSILALWP